MKKMFALLALAAMLLPLLAACGGGGTTTCAEGDICVTVGKDEPIRIAYMMVVSGSDATLGQDTKYGVEVAIDDRGGTLLGHKIELIG